MLDFLDEEKESFILVVEVLNFDFHFIDFGGFGVAFEFDDGLVLLCDFEVEFFDDFFKA